jgi:lyso-ornithine lipid O-acyltransferase
MKSWLKHPLRVTARLSWLGAELLKSAFNYGVHCVFRPQDSLPAARAMWLQNSSRRLLRVFRIETKFTGDIPSSGLLVCNHLGYLDILVLSALVPCVFVAKQEVKHWPVFGWFAKLAGTVFVHREQRSQAVQTVDEIEAALQTGAVVVLFPEGTSSGGETVLPFKSSLLEPAARQTCSLAAGLLQYELGDGDVSEEVCYWKDMTLVPHLINLCSKRAVRASVQFNCLREGKADRKQLARQLHAEVLRMKHAVAI